MAHLSAPRRCRPPRRVSTTTCSNIPTRHSPSTERKASRTVICEQKHMGSRAVVVLCKDEAVSKKRFGVVQASLGTVYTRTGRRFFTDEALEHHFLGRLQSAVERSGLWDELATDWLCLDCELMPWSAKAQELLQKQYAPVGNTGRPMLLRAESDTHCEGTIAACPRSWRSLSAAQSAQRLRRCRALHAGLSAILLAGRTPLQTSSLRRSIILASEARSPHRQAAHLAHGDDRQALRRRHRDPTGDSVQDR